MQTVSMAGTSGGQSSLEYASLVSNWEMPNQTAPRPSIFDILAQENMHALFKSAFDHLLRRLTSHTTRLARLSRFTDEIYLLAHGFIECMYLKTYNALFSEHFYSMKRVPSFSSKFKTVLTALFSILVPYIKSKLDSLYEELEKETSEGVERGDTSLKSRLVKLLLKYYPYFHLIWSVVFWYFRIAFMIRKTDYHSPIIAALGQHLVYNIDLMQQTQSFGWSTLRTDFVKTVLYFSNNIFTAGMYLLQFMKWYQESEENESDQSTSTTASSITSDQVAQTICNIALKNNHKNQEDEEEDLDIIPAPRLPDKLLNSKPYRMLVEKTNQCPLCNRTRTNQCVLAVSGFCFCYPCIFKFVKEHKRCPITSFPCSTKSIIRLYITAE